jgi:hypothetical protein
MNSRESLEKGGPNANLPKEKGERYVALVPELPTLADIRLRRRTKLRQTEVWGAL